MVLELDGLDRVAKRDPTLQKTELTAREAQFLTFIFLHMTCSFELARQGEIINIEQFRYDVSTFLEAPLVATFWESRRKYYNRDFTAFVDRCVRDMKSKTILPVSSTDTQVTE